MKKIKYIISVGEPWDFECIDGQNIIKGDVLLMTENKIVFKSNNELQFDNIKGNILILTPRYENCNFRDLIDPVIVNGAMLLEEYSQLNEIYLSNNLKPVMIGSIRKE